ncbi:MAG: SGNH/GDSL hydrolase family protein [Candidatus Sumerlaeota bacterium]
MVPLIEAGQTVLFQGDSITDAGRNREDGNHLGFGYANMAAAWYSALHPEMKVTFLNRGISGNRAHDLVKRWDEDCIDLQPDWVSILIGINDVWRRYDNDDPTSAEDFERDYTDILQRTRENTDARLILCEPFVLHTAPDREAWREDLDPKIEVVSHLAKEFGAMYVSFDWLFAAAAAKRQPAFWAHDGVHPTQPGHALMAQAWLRALRVM